jgi:hypothetical protein
MSRSRVDFYTSILQLTTFSALVGSAYPGIALLATPLSCGDERSYSALCPGELPAEHGTYRMHPIPHPADRRPGVRKTAPCSWCERHLRLGERTVEHSEVPSRKPDALAHSSGGQPTTVDHRVSLGRFLAELRHGATVLGIALIAYVVHIWRTTNE